jgi:hypothetical protein
MSRDFIIPQNIAPQKKFPKINFTCQNICSLNISKPSKKTYSKLAATVKNGSDIILLSDTRLNSDRQIAGVNDIEKRLKFLGYSMIHNSHNNSRGTAILIPNRLDHTVDNTYKDEECNILLVKIKIKGVSVTFGCIYCSNKPVLHRIIGLKLFGQIRQNRTWRLVSAFDGGHIRRSVPRA